MLSIIIGIVRSAGGIFGAAPVFLTAVVLGFLALPMEKRRANLAIVVIYILFLFGMLFYVSSHPGDVVLRLWIPLVVILFGLVGEAFCYAWRLSRDFLQNLKAKANLFNLVNCLPLILIAVLLGYALQMIATGGEQVYTYIDFLRQRQPLVFNPANLRCFSLRPNPGTGYFITVLSSCPTFLSTAPCAWGRFIIIPPSRAMRQQKNLCETLTCIMLSPIIRQYIIPHLQGWTKPVGGSPVPISAILPWTSREDLCRWPGKAKLPAKIINGWSLRWINRILQRFSIF